MSDFDICTMEVLPMDEQVFRETISEIVSAIKEAGYDPYEQLVGYLKTGQEYYITRTRNARSLIKSLEREQIQQYVSELKSKR